MNKPFEIIMISAPTESHLIYWLKEAEKYGIKGKKFEKLWFEAYNKMLAREAEREFYNKRFKIAEILIKNGHTIEIRNSGRKILNKAIEALNKKFEINCSKLKEEI